MMVPTSLLAHITDTSATSSWVCSASRSAAADTEPSEAVGSQVTWAPSCSTSQFDRVQHRVVFHLGGDDAATARLGVAAGPVDALDGQVVALGAAGGEDHL